MKLDLSEHPVGTSQNLSVARTCSSKTRTRNSIWRELQELEFISFSGYSIPYPSEHLDVGYEEPIMLVC